MQRIGVSSPSWEWKVAGMCRDGGSRDENFLTNAAAKGLETS